MKNRQKPIPEKDTEEARRASARRFLDAILIPLVEDAARVTPHDVFVWFRRYRREMARGGPGFELADVWRAARSRQQFYEKSMGDDSGFPPEGAETLDEVIGLLEALIPSGKVVGTDSPDELDELP